VPIDQPTAFNASIVYPGTSDYEKRVATFKISANQASDLVPPYVGDRSPACVIGDWYLFTKPYKYKRIDLAGTYVNGHTGQVEERESGLSLIGDNSMMGMFKPFPEDMPVCLAEARPYR